MRCKPPAVESVRPELAEATCDAPVYIESRTIYNAADNCKPKVSATTPNGSTGVSTEACNLTELRANGYFTSGNFKTGDGISFAGCGTPTSPWYARIDYAFLIQKIVGDEEVGATVNKCGLKVKNGFVTAVGALVNKVTSADQTLTVTTSADGCSVDLKMNPVGNVNTLRVQYTRPICLQCFEYTVLGMAWVEISGDQFIVFTCVTSFGNGATISAGSGPFNTLAEAINAANTVTMGGCQAQSAGGA